MVMVSHWLICSFIPYSTPLLLYQTFPLVILTESSAFPFLQHWTAIEEKFYPCMHVENVEIAYLKYKLPFQNDKLVKWFPFFFSWKTYRRRMSTQKLPDHNQFLHFQSTLIPIISQNGISFIVVYFLIYCLSEKIVKQQKFDHFVLSILFPSHKDSRFCKNIGNCFTKCNQF